MKNKFLTPCAARRHLQPTLLSVLVASALSFAAHAAHAQEAGQPAPQADKAKAQEPDPALQSVIVTGTRRREPLREVPLVVSSLSALELARSGSQRLSEYVETLPGLNVDGGGRGLQQLSIRGITIGGDINPPTSTYLDDIAFGASSQYGAKLSLDIGTLDLNHMEIYRGPQGTLYGANALGGVLKYVFNEPVTDEFSGNVGLDVSSVSHGRINSSVSAVLNLPLKEDVAGVRVGVIQSRDGGHVDAIGPLPGKGVERSDVKGFRVAGVLMPSKLMTIKLVAMGQDIRRDGSDYSAYTIDGKPVTTDFEYTRHVAEPFRQKVGVFSADLEYELHWARLNVAASHQTNRNGYATDLSAVYVPLLVDAFAGLNSVWTNTQVDTTKDTLEVRLTSAKSRSLEWIAGLYGSREKNTVEQGIATGLDTGPGPDLLGASIPTSFRERAAFGDVTFYPTTNFAVTAGARASHNQQTFQQAYTGPLAPGNPSVPSASADSSKTYLLTGRYALGKKSNVYVRIASGYNPGGVNAALLDPVSGVAVTENPTYRPNTLVSSELGYKADLFDNRLSLETAIYHLRWKDIQLAHVAAAGAEVINGGRARVNGAELAATLRPLPGWSLTTALSYIDARLTDDVPDLSAVAGDRLPITARWSGVLRATRNFVLAGWPAHAGVSYRYIGARNSDFVGSANPPLYVMPAYSTVGLQAGIDIKPVVLNLFVRNATNTKGQSSAVTGYVPIGGPVHVTLDEPRTVGFSANVSF